MPLEIPKSPVQPLHHRVSGFSIPGRLPCLLAVVLGLFAHSEALAQRLTNLTIARTGGDGDVVLNQDFAATRFNYTATADNAVEDLTVTADPVAGHTVTFEGTDSAQSGVLTSVPVGRTRITVTVTDDSDPPQTQDYRIDVTRPADTTASLQVAFTGGGYLAGESLEPAFDPATRNYEAIVTAATTAVTVTVDATSPTAEEITWDTGLPGSPHTRNLGTGTPQQNTITATVKDGTSTGRYTIRVTKSDFPGAPRNLRATARNVGKEVALSWSAPSDAGDAPIVGYQVAQYDEFQLEADADNELTDGELTWGDDLGEVLSHRVTGLHNGRTYYFRVRALNENGPGNGSNDDSDTPAGPPLAPTLLDPVAGNARVELTWVAPMDPANIPPDGNPISSYEYSQNGSWRPIRNSDESTTSYTATSLNNGTTYQFSVRAKNHAGNGFPSNEVRAVPRAGVPGAPTGLTAQAGDEEVTLSWRAPANSGGEPITRYEYKEEATSGGTAGTWTTTGGTGTTVTVRGLDNGETYYFKVRAVNDSRCAAEPERCGQESLEVSAKPIGKPVTEVNLEAESDQDSRVVLTWVNIYTAPPPADEDRSGFQYRQNAGGGYGSWIDIRNSDANTERHVVSGLTNGTTYSFLVRAVNSSGGGPASDEQLAVPSIPPGAPRNLTATAGDKEVRLTWTPPADDGGRRIIRYECEGRTGARIYMPCANGKSLGASATSLTLTEDEGNGIGTVGIENYKTYTFRVLAVNDREGRTDTSDNPLDPNGDGDWSDEASATPTDRSGTQQTFTISATIDGKSWAKDSSTEATILATVEVNPRYTAPSTDLWVDVDGGGFDDRKRVEFGPTNSRRDVSFTDIPAAGDITIALLGSDPDDPSQADDDLSKALAVTSVEIRPGTTPDPPTGLVATRGDGEVTLSWATPLTDGGDIVVYDYDYRQKRQAGSYGRWTEFAGRELQSTTVTSNTVTGLTDGGTYAFQVRAVALTGSPPTRVANAESGPSDEVSVSLSGTVDTGALSAPRSFAAAAGDGQVTLSWTAPAADGGAAISGYEYQQRAGAGAYGQWTTIPGGSSVQSFIVTGLANGTRYFFRGRAVNRDGGGPPSTEQSATPSLAVDTTLRALSLSTVTLAPAFTPATRTYTAAVGSSVTQVTVTATPNKPGATATITPADANTAADGHQVVLVVGSNPIRVRVTDRTDTDDYTITVTRAGRVPAAPTGLTATADEDGGGAVTLSWTAPTGGGAVSRYEYRQKAGTGAYGAWTRMPGSGPSTMSYTVTGLTNGTAYVFRVRAVNSVGNGAASNEATATPAFVKLVWAKTEKEVADAITAARNAGYGADRTFAAGETIEVRGSTLFNAAEGVSLTFTTASDDPDAASSAASDGTVTVTARAAGMATITITAQASQPSGVTIVEQTDPREASIRFDVEVGLEALTLELSGPEDGTNLVEGGRVHANGTVGTVTVTVEANRPVTEDVTVTLMADRALSDATAADFEAAPIVIEAGKTTGSTVVTAVEDETAEEMEELVLFGVAAGNAGEVTGEVRLRLWDAAVPVLPVIAQLLLAAFLAIGGYRRYRRR